MPVDYSKWDALELSDDSDFEPHPNVDKRSFIRAKQSQIHMQRAERKNQIETLKHERVINDGLLRRIDTLLAELRSHEAEAKDPNAFLYQALIASAGDPDDDEAPKPPPDVHAKNSEPIRYSQMMGSLVDQVKKEVEDSHTQDWFRGYMKGIEGHKRKVAELQKELQAKLVELEDESSKKITSDSIRDGFNSSHVSRSKQPTASSKSKVVGEAVEVLNPGALKKERLIREEAAQSSGADADIDEAVGPLEDAEEDEPEPSDLGKQFVKIHSDDYQGCLRFISQNRQVMAERETDGLLVYAFDAALKGNLDHAKHCVHQALLLQYCRSLGGDGVQLFFKRMTTPGHQARKVFYDDVNSTFNRIKSRTAELAAERAAEGQTEQIQLQAVEPGTEIHINVPQPDSEEAVEQQARAIFKTFPPGFQRALESGSLDRINEVLGKMSVEEAEEIVEQLGHSGMLDMRQGVIDGTTEEGQNQLRRMKETDKAADSVEERVQDLASESSRVKIEDPD